jgi:hypothetical protein
MEYCDINSFQEAKWDNKIEKKFEQQLLRLHIRGSITYTFALYVSKFVRGGSEVLLEAFQRAAATGGDGLTRLVNKSSL